jgi:predicted O-methyltransferase YrrM
MPSMLQDPKLESLLAALHARSASQEGATQNYFFKERTGPWLGMEPRDHAHYADKLVALDADKSEFCYGLCRAIGARRIVEVGTSFGVSTLYLAAAIRDNGGGTVIGAEYEPQKVKAAVANFEAAGLSDYIDLREGDVLDIFKTLQGPIDFVLFDIWGHVVRPALDLLLPKLRPGAVICTDNTGGDARKGGYAPFFEIIDDPAFGFRTITMPFKAGFEMSVKGR